MKKHNSILFSLLIGIIYAHKFMVEINFNDLSQLHQLVEMGIDLDHHRNLTEVHAFVTEDEFQTISNLNFSIHEIPNKAKTKIIGNNQYFFLSIKNSKNSFKKLMCYN